MSDNSSNKNQSAINERLNFLIKSLNMSARAFSAALGVPDSNTRNYLSKGTKLNADYLERIAVHFKNISLNWLITGEGEPFLTPPTENTPPTTNAKKISRSQIIGSNNQGITNQHQNSAPTADDEVLTTKLTLAEKERDLAAAQKEIALLTSQLADKERTIQILLKQTS